MNNNTGFIPDEFDPQDYTFLNGVVRARSIDQSLRNSLNQRET